MSTFRNLALFLAFSLFFGITSANACGGNKAHTKYHKGKTTTACMSSKCMKKGTCTDPSCMKDGKCTGGAAAKTSTSECTKAAAGSHHCCMDKADKS